MEAVFQRRYGTIQKVYSSRYVCKEKFPYTILREVSDGRAQIMGHGRPLVRHDCFCGLIEAGAGSPEGGMREPSTLDTSYVQAL